MKITNKTLLVNFETEVKLGNNDAIEVTLLHNAFIGRSKTGELDIDIELGIDIINVKFLGVAIKTGYEAYREFKCSLSTLGIDLDKLISEKEDEIRDSGIEDKLKLMFKDKF